MYLTQRTSFSLAIFFILAFLVTSCKKKKAFNQENAQVTVDVRMTESENDEILKDINVAIMEQYLMRGKTRGSNTPTTSICGVKLDTTQITQGILMLNYDGSNCYGRTRTGSVKFSILGYPLKKWKHKGCQIKIEYFAYNMQRTSDSKIVQFDGEQMLTNESGNSWFELWYMGEPSVVYRVTGQNLKVTFEGKNTAMFNFDRRLTYTHSNNVTACTISGLGSANGKSDLICWGQTREGDDFSAQVVSNPVWKTTCGAVALLSGETSISVSGKEFDIISKYGVDASGKAVDEGSCPFGWEASWKWKKRTNTLIFGYY